MADFWELSDGGDVAKTGSKFETGGGSLEPLPDRTQAIAVVDEAKVDTNRDNLRFVSLRWSIVSPAEYKGRKVFQKIWCLDDNPNKPGNGPKDTAKKMLFAIDANAGGKLKASGKYPTTELLTMSITNKPMQIRIMLMKRDDGSLLNWISSVEPKLGGGSTMTAAAAPKAAAADLDDEVPF